MAAVTETKLVNITINDTEIAVPAGELIVESVKRLGLEIPIFCYHPRMKPVGMCRMCLVEVGFKQPDGSVRKMPKPQAGCTLPASEGMVVYTDTELVHRDRKGVLEFLLINHPLDCPICDRGGECPLQNNTLFYGPSTSRYVHLKRHLPKAFPLSQYVTLDLERCIQCGRCVRFTEEISGDAQLAFRFRGASMQPSTFELRDFGSKFSGNVIEICPVGALTSAKYRFRARPWDLETKPAVCTLCSNGCNIWFDYRVGRMVRINGRTNEAVNEEWTCDKGKFGHEFYNASDRPSRVLVRKGAALSETNWSEAYAEILRTFRNAGGENVGVLAGGQLSNEDLYLLRRLFVRDFGSKNLDHRFTAHLPTRRPSRQEASIADLESKDAILSFGTSLADDSPIVFLRVRKAWFKHGARVVVAHDGPTDLDSFAHVLLRYRPGTAGVLAAGLAGQMPAEAVVAQTGVDARSYSEAVEALAGNVAVLTTTGIYDQADGSGIVDSLEALATKLDGTLNVMPRAANERGAQLLGIEPEAGALDTHAMLAAAAEGRLKALWLAGVDLFKVGLDASLVERALENVEFLVVQDSVDNACLPFASVVLPMAAPAEMDGSFTNVESRVQRFSVVLAPKGEAKPAWRVYSELGLRVHPETPLFNAGEVMDRIGAEHPRFAAAAYGSLPTEGARV